MDFYYDESGNLLGFQYNNADYYYIKNVQGDIIGIIDANGTEVVSYEYDTWGKLLETSGTQATTIGKLNPFRYRGYCYDEESGLYYLQSRYYDPVVGRFVSADDVAYLGATGSVLSYNLYTYCENNAVNNYDSNGYFSIRVYVVAAITTALIGAIAKIISNYTTGKRGKALFLGVLGAAMGTAVNSVLLMKLIRKGGEGMVIAAFCAGAVQSLMDFAESVLIGKRSNWSQLSVDFIWNSATMLAGNYLGGKMVFINKGWFQPKYIKSFFTKSYGQRLLAQTGIGSILSIAIDLIRSGFKKIK